MKKIKVVPDINILVSAFILKVGKPREIFNKFIHEEIIFILSEKIFEELIEVLKKRKFDLISNEEKTDFIKRITELAEIVSPKERIEIIKQDFTDNKIIEAAVEGNADYIITGDEHLLSLKEFRGIKILNAKEFLELFKDVN